MNGIAAIAIALLTAIYPNTFPERYETIIQKTIPNSHLLASAAFLGEAKPFIDSQGLKLNRFFSGLKKGRAKNINPYFSDKQAFDLDVWLFEEKNEDIRIAIDHFQQVLHWVNVNVRTFSETSEYYTSIQKALKDKNPPDIVMMRNSWLKEFQPQLHPAPNDLFTREECYDFFYPFACDAFSSADAMFGAPLLVKPLVMIINRRMLDDDRVTVGGMPDGRWFGFIENGRNFSRYSANKGYFSFTNPTNNIFPVELLFGSLFLQAESMGQSGPEAVKDILELIENINAVATPSGIRRISGDPIEQFAQGQIAILFGTQDTYQKVVDILARNAKAPLKREDLAIAPIPQINPQDPVTIADAWALVVPKTSGHKDQAWGLAAFFLEEDNMEAYSNRPGKIPARRHILYRNPFGDAASNAKNPPKNIGSLAFTKLIRENLDELLGRKKTREEAADIIYNFLQSP